MPELCLTEREFLNACYRIKSANRNAAGGDEHNHAGYHIRDVFSNKFVLFADTTHLNPYSTPRKGSPDFLEAEIVNEYNCIEVSAAIGPGLHFFFLQDAAFDRVNELALDPTGPNRIRTLNVKDRRSGEWTVTAIRWFANPKPYILIRIQSLNPLRDLNNLLDAMFNLDPNFRTDETSDMDGDTDDD